MFGLLSVDKVKQDNKEQENLNHAIKSYKKLLPSSEDFFLVKENYGISVFCSNNRAYLSEVSFNLQKGTHEFISRLTLDLLDENLVIDKNEIYLTNQPKKITHKTKYENGWLFSHVEVSTTISLLKVQFNNVDLKDFIYSNLNKHNQKQKFSKINF